MSNKWKFGFYNDDNDDDKEGYNDDDNDGDNDGDNDDNSENCWDLVRFWSNFRF